VPSVHRDRGTERAGFGPVKSRYLAREAERRSTLARAYVAAMHAGIAGEDTEAARWIAWCAE
jgi:hypothetical protein